LFLPNELRGIPAEGQSPSRIGLRLCEPQRLKQRTHCLRILEASFPENVLRLGEPEFGNDLFHSRG